jgi:phage N-6-adenine-methyltransferase
MVVADILPISTGDLPLYDAACRALALARSVNEVASIRATADALRAAAKVAKSKQLEINAVELRHRAERRLGELEAEQKRTVGFNTGSRGQLKGDVPVGATIQEGPTDTRPTLAEAGIDYKLSARAQKIAAMPEVEFEAGLAAWRAEVEEEGVRVFLVPAHHHRALGTGENEWYTPDEDLNVVREVLGEIDLDPASSDAAQEIIRAKAYFTKADDGLAQPWHGRVWLNPPYAQPWMGQFAQKMVEEYTAGRVKAAIMLTHNYTDTNWFRLLGTVCEAVCFKRGRVKFYDATGKVAAPTQGQAFFYFGPDRDLFEEKFGGHGSVWTPTAGLRSGNTSPGHGFERLVAGAA